MSRNKARPAVSVPLSPQRIAKEKEKERLAQEGRANGNGALPAAGNGRVTITKVKTVPPKVKTVPAKAKTVPAKAAPRSLPTAPRPTPVDRRRPTPTPGAAKRAQTATFVAPAPGPSRLGMVVGTVGAALAVVGAADALARTGHDQVALPILFAGIAVIVVACGWRLTSRTASRNERIAVSLVLGVGLFVAAYLSSPLIFNGFDELLTGTTVNSMLNGRALSVHNSILPVSSYYPGLELVTIAVKWATGLPLVLAELVVLLAIRIVLVLSVFLVVERVCRSSLAGGIGVLVYASNPQFFTFDGQFAYETLALALSVAAFHFLLRAIDGSPRRSLLLSISAVAALVVTHHLTAWLTTAFFVVFALGLLVTGRRRAARPAGLAAAASVALCGAWTLFVGSHLDKYLRPILSAAARGFGSAIGQLHANRQLFHTANGQGASTTWEIAFMVAAAVCWCLLLLPSTVAVLRKKTLGGGALRFLPVVVALLYVVALGATLSSASSEVGQRATTFTFFGMAVVVGGWLAARLSSPRPPSERGAILAVIAVCFLGSTMFGAGPNVTLVPGHYLVGADTRSFNTSSLDLARWAAVHLPAGSTVAADRDNGALLAEMSHVQVSTAIGGKVNTSQIFFDRIFGRYDVTLIRRADIRYVVTDLRLASSLPLFGSYVEPGVGGPRQLLTVEELSKFNRVPAVHRIYDNGPIQVYDVSALLGTGPPAPPHNYGTVADQTDWAVLIAALVALALLLAVRLRWGRVDEGAPEERTLRILVGAAVAAMVFAAVAVPSHFSATTIGLFAVIAGLVFALLWRVVRRVLRARAQLGRPRAAAAPERRAGGWAWPAAAVAVGLLLAGTGVALSTGTAARQWHPVTAVWLSSTESGAARLDVQLAPDDPGGRLVVGSGPRKPLTMLVGGGATHQSFVLPSTFAPGSVTAVLTDRRGDLSVRG